MALIRPQKVALGDVPSNRRRGGDVRALLTPATTGATSGFMGAVTLDPGEFVSEHYHPYSEEFLVVVRGTIDTRLDGEGVVRLTPGEGLLIPIGTRHRLLNDCAEQAFAIFHLGPLAPRPDMGHVDTEPYPEPEAATDREVQAR